MLPSTTVMSFTQSDSLAVHQQPATQTLRLRRQQNALAPISRLPPEVLTHIFEYCLGSFGSYYWLRQATHVCSTWRAIALSAGSLWSSLGFNRPLYAKQMLRRSGASPLQVCIFNDGVCEALEEALALNSYRISSFYISAGSKRFEQYIKLCTRPAPMLTSLRLFFEDERTNELARNHSTIDLDRIFASDLPNLVSLYLSQCNFDSLLPFCGTKLQHMDIDGLEIPVDHLHDALRSACQLQTLIIHNSVRDARTVQYNPSPVHLLALRRLSIRKETASSALAFLSPVVCTFSDFDNDKTFVAVALEPLDGDAATQYQVAAIAAWVCASLAEPITGIFISGRAGVIHCFPGGRLPGAAQTELHLHSPVKLSFDFPQNDSSTMGVLSAACLREMPWASIVLLGIVSGAYMGKLAGRGWGDIFRQAKRVETLSVCGGSLQREFGALLEQDADGQAVLPRLQKVVVAEMENNAEEMEELWHILHKRLRMSSTITLSLNHPYWKPYRNDPYREAQQQNAPFPHTLRETMEADPRIHVLWQGNAIDLNTPRYVVGVSHAHPKNNAACY